MVQVVAQVLDYPANERWIGLSRDAYLLLTDLERRALRLVCRDKGIGLLLVHDPVSIRVLVKPRAFQVRVRGRDFLSHYANADKLRKLILT